MGILCLQKEKTDMEKRYKNTGIRQIVVEEIQEIARKNGINTVLLFGSRARGDYKERSDIDLAVEGGIQQVLRWRLTKKPQLF